MTENPLYRRGYVDSPFQQQQYWRPPSNEYAVRYNQNPNAAQDLRNLFGTFFAQNSAAQIYSPQYQPPRYSDYYQTMPQVKQSVKKNRPKAAIFLLMNHFVSHKACLSLLISLPLRRPHNLRHVGAPRKIVNRHVKIIRKAAQNIKAGLLLSAFVVLVSAQRNPDTRRRFFLADTFGSSNLTQPTIEPFITMPRRKLSSLPIKITSPKNSSAKRAKVLSTAVRIAKST